MVLNLREINFDSSFKKTKNSSQLRAKWYFILKIKVHFLIDDPNNNENLPENIIPAIKEKDMPILEKVHTSLFDLADNRGIKEKETPKSPPSKFLFFLKKFKKKKL